jgi:hypothetical protein
MASVGSHLGGEWAYHDLIHIYLVRLLNRELDRPPDCCGLDRDLSIGLHPLACDRIANGVCEFRCDHTWE